MNGSTWTAKDEDYLRSQYADTSLAQLAQHLGRTVKAVRTRAKVLQLRRGNRKSWTSGDDQYLRDHYADTLTSDIAQNLKRPLYSIYNRAACLGLVKSVDYLNNPATRCRLPKGTKIGAECGFVKGQTPANKGIRRPGWATGRMRETQFKKGELSGRAAQVQKPLGTVLADHEGYLRIKVRERDENTHGWHKDVWRLLHHKTWTESHGPIPPGHIVVFKDKDRSNCVIENLECISMAENARRNNMWSRYPREVCEAIQLTGALKRRIRKLNAEK